MLLSTEGTSMKGRLMRLASGTSGRLSQAPTQTKGCFDFLEHVIRLPVPELLLYLHHLWAQSNPVPGHLTITPSLGF